MMQSLSTCLLNAYYVHSINTCRTHEIYKRPSKMNRTITYEEGLRAMETGNSATSYFEQSIRKDPTAKVTGVVA